MEEREPNAHRGALNLNTLLTLPVVKAVGFAVACVMLGAGAREYMLRLTSEVETVRREVSNVLYELGRMRTEMSADLDRRTADQMTRTDAKLWSYELERVNGGKITVPPLPPPR